MNQPVQILLATYNSAPFLAELVESLRAQTFPHWTLLIRDDASSDQTPTLLAAYAGKHPDRITLMPPCARNGGALANFAALLDAADADYVMFADADDVWLPDKVARTLDRMRQMETTHGPSTPLLVHTDLRVVNRDLSLRSESLWRYQAIDAVAGACLNRLLIENVVTGCTAMLNRPLVELVRPIPRAGLGLKTGAMPTSAWACDGTTASDMPTPTWASHPANPASASAPQASSLKPQAPPQALPVMHDWWIALAAAAFGHIGRVNQPTILYRQHGGNLAGAHAFKWVGTLLKARRFFDRRELDAALACSQAQASAFLERYHQRLTPAQADMVHAYAGLSRQSPLMRRRLIFRHAFWRTGLARNLSLLLRG